jgi:hypothetical protein
MCGWDETVHLGSNPKLEELFLKRRQFDCWQGWVDDVSTRKLEGGPIRAPVERVKAGRSKGESRLRLVQLQSCKCCLRGRCDTGLLAA